MDHLRAVYRYLSTGEYPEKATKEEKRGIRKKASTFVLKGKYLYVPEKNGECLRRVVTDEEEKTASLNEVHAGHFGIKRMMGKINQRFYWKGS
ncbi:UNVERIFIED_CONTAM: hypothetical protein FKN15_010700 [Acipenser sinensis]